MAVLINQDGLTGYRNCPAPAKLNLFLHVVGRRPNGYHLLESAFQLIDLCDCLHFTNRSDGAIHRINEIEGVPEEADLTVRAAARLKYGSRTGTDAFGWATDYHSEMSYFV